MKKEMLEQMEYSVDYLAGRLWATCFLLEKEYNKINKFKKARLSTERNMEQFRAEPVAIWLQIRPKIQKMMTSSYYFNGFQRKIENIEYHLFDKLHWEENCILNGAFYVGFNVEIKTYYGLQQKERGYHKWVEELDLY